MVDNAPAALRLHLPLESVARKRLAASQIEFARAAVEVLRGSEDIHYEACDAGFRTLAADEDSLDHATLALRTLYGDLIDVQAPAIRLLQGTPVRQPMMAVRVSMRAEHRDTVCRELGERGVQVVEERFGARLLAVRGTAPLARLLGLPARLAVLTRGAAVHWIRLSHYAAIEGEVRSARLRQ